MRTLSLILFLIGPYLPIELIAQAGNVYTNTNFSNNGAVVEIKWYSTEIFHIEGINVYRRSLSNESWTKLTISPILPQSAIPDSIENSANENLLLAYELASGQSNTQVQSIFGLNMLIQSFHYSHLAEFMGIYYRDGSVVQGETYFYRIVKVKNGQEELIGESDAIIAGYSNMESSPQDVKIRDKKGKVEFTWKEEETRFYAVNIYRKSNKEKDFQRINELPVMVSESDSSKPEKFKIHYSDENVREKQTYQYYLKAINFFGLESEPSETLSVNIKDTIPPLPPRSLRKKDVRDQVVSLSWRNNEYIEATGIYVYRSYYPDSGYIKANSRQLSITDTVYNDTLKSTAGVYYYVATVDESGNEGRSNKIFVHIEDLVAPSPPENIFIEADSGRITLSWDANTESDLQGYQVFRTIDSNEPDRYVLLNSKPIAKTTFTDHLPAKAKNKFLYCVVAVDSSYNQSKFSEFAAARMPDTYPPLKPVIKSVRFINDSLLISWIPNSDPDLAGYKVLRSEKNKSRIELGNMMIASTTNQTCDLTAEENKLYEYYIQAFDSAGNASPLSNPFTARLPKRSNVLDEAIVLKLKYKKPTGMVKLNWNNLEFKTFQQKRIIGYTVFKGNSENELHKATSMLSPEIAKYKDNEISKDRNYYYQVRAYYESGDILLSPVIVISTYK